MRKLEQELGGGIVWEVGLDVRRRSAAAEKGIGRKKVTERSEG